MQFRLIVVTDPHCPPARPPATDRGDYNTLHHSLVRRVVRIQEVQDAQLLQLNTVFIPSEL